MGVGKTESAAAHSKDPGGHLRQASVSTTPSYQQGRDKGRGKRQLLGWGGVGVGLSSR